MVLFCGDEPQSKNRVFVNGLMLFSDSTVKTNVP